ncbi:MAG: type I restriction enzyme HsdR N-terminal domain-containing protein [Spirochaetaceae bacterium]|nr:type I restriction enzyme HsdR N-terminal domain-containing protein [Spirochaetaceae bacterium]
MENWNKLCKAVKPLIAHNASESKLNEVISKELKTTFEWNDIGDEYMVTMAKDKKRADFVLLKDDFGIVLELKRPGLTLEEGKNQLMSYMRIMGYKYGFLIGSKIIYFYDDAPPKFESYATIEFDINDKIGLLFGEVLKFNYCTKENLEKFRLYAIKTKGGGSEPYPTLIPDHGKQPGTVDLLKQEYPERNRDFAEVIEAFEQEGFEMKDHVCDQDWTKSINKNGIFFTPHFRCKAGDKRENEIWQVVWESSGNDRKWIDDQEPIIKKIYNNCYLYSQTRGPHIGKLWIPATTNQDAPLKEIIDNMIKIVRDTAGTMGYPLPE